MPLLMSLVDESKQPNQAQFPFRLNYHGPKGRYKIIHQGLMIPGLPAPLHYFNFLTFIGQPNIPMIRNQCAIKTYPLDTVSLISSVSPHMVGHFHGYSIQNDCEIRNGYFRFGQKELLVGNIPKFRFVREDTELTVDLDIETYPLISNFTNLKLGLFDHWSLLCRCVGEINYKGQRYPIDHLGSFEYARAINIPYLPLNFCTYQIINLSAKRQILLVQIRNNFNQITQSRIYLRDLKRGYSEVFAEGVVFKVHRVYPKVKTPNGHEMYLPRDFEWCYSKGAKEISVRAESRGDYKFGLAAGYVGSFKYTVKIDNQEESGESGYCEYIDCRALKFQESEDQQKCVDKMLNQVPFSLKK